MDVFYHLRAVHAHAHAVHDVAVVIKQVVIDPVNDAARFLNAPHPREHDGARAIGGHVHEILAQAPRQHAQRFIEAFVDIALQGRQPLRRLCLLQAFHATEGQREPGLVVVVLILGQLREVADANAAQGVIDAVAAHLGVIAQRRINEAVQVVGLPPVVPVDKELFLRGGRPADHGKIGARQAPYGVRVALIDGGLCEFGAVGPLFFHDSSITPVARVDIASVTIFLPGICQIGVLADPGVHGDAGRDTRVDGAGGAKLGDGAGHHRGILGRLRHAGAFLAE